LIASHQHQFVKRKSTPILLRAVDRAFDIKSPSYRINRIFKTRLPDEPNVNKMDTAVRSIPSVGMQKQDLAHIGVYPAKPV
jgi:hypothetical protein